MTFQVTSSDPSSTEKSPGVKPTATRAGMPSTLAMAAIAEAKCTQYPARRSRNGSSTAAPEPSYRSSTGACSE